MARAPRLSLARLTIDPALATSLNSTQSRQRIASPNRQTVSTRACDVDTRYLPQGGHATL